ncbi:putative phage abortive infection protein [Leptospira wolffii]|uniref:putative phage abortive infection protein n=1 Tax=Leptospira wolffii TaxID=409998 RepID=UPI000353739A|nr:putative phage abortive infection protein [Leptospira wolffii]EPG65616.1 hypothetical protein LEP1GSC061_0103 [Leptospira wolffii serovar Khorat str. Khorat-H2]
MNIKNELNEGKIPLVYIGILIFVLLLIYFGVPVLLTQTNIFGISYSNTGQIGDTIGGLSSPLIAAVAAFLTFLAFWVQYQSNKQQTLQFKSQDKVQQIERFEDKFYKLIELHRSNVAELEMPLSRTGRSIFIPLYDELRFAYEILEFVDLFEWKDKRLIKKEEKINISYITFFLGIENNDSISVLKEILKKYPEDLVLQYLNEIKKVQEKYDPSTNRIDLGNYKDKILIEYRPFKGHINQLGHYYRHLFQIYRLLEDQPNELNKYEYSKVIRSQLAVFEQLLLFYNIQSTLGSKWITRGFVRDYKVFKNMPVLLATFGPTPTEFLERNNIKSDDFFEWDEFSE